MTKLLGVALDCKLSWSKHVDTTVAKMGISLSIIKHCSAFLTTLSTRQVLQALVLLYLDYCSVVWSVATKRDVRKLQLAQNRALKCTQRANNNNIHDMLNAPRCLFKLLAHSSDNLAYPKIHATIGLFSVP